MENFDVKFTEKLMEKIKKNELLINDFLELYKEDYIDQDTAETLVQFFQD